MQQPVEVKYLPELDSDWISPGEYIRMMRTLITTMMFICVNPHVILKIEEWGRRTYCGGSIMPIASLRWVLMDT